MKHSLILKYLPAWMKNPTLAAPFSAGEISVYATLMLIGLAIFVWFAVPAYRSYAICYNVKAVIAIWTFIPALLIADLLSRLANARLSPSVAGIGIW